MNFSVTRLRMKSRFFSFSCMHQNNGQPPDPIPTRRPLSLAAPLMPVQGGFSFPVFPTQPWKDPRWRALEWTWAPLNELGVLARVPFPLCALEHELKNKRDGVHPGPFPTPTPSQALWATHLDVIVLLCIKYTHKLPAQRCLASKCDHSIMGFEMFGNLTPDFVIISSVTVIRWWPNKKLLTGEL